MSNKKVNFETILNMEKNRYFHHSNWKNFTHGFNGVPSYHGNNVLMFRLIELWGWLMPRALSAKLHVFLQKRP